MFRWSLSLLFVLPMVIRAGEPVRPVLEARPAVLEKLKNLKTNHAVLLGQAKVLGDFNDTARKYNLHKTGPLARDFTLKVVWRRSATRPFSAAPTTACRIASMMSGNSISPPCRG